MELKLLFAPWDAVPARNAMLGSPGSELQGRGPGAEGPG